MILGNSPTESSASLCSARAVAMNVGAVVALLTRVWVSENEGILRDCCELKKKARLGYSTNETQIRPADYHASRSNPNSMYTSYKGPSFGEDQVPPLASAYGRHANPLFSMSYEFVLSASLSYTPLLDSTAY